MVFGIVVVQVFSCAWQLHKPYRHLNVVLTHPNMSLDLVKKLHEPLDFY